MKSGKNEGRKEKICRERAGFNGAANEPLWERDKKRAGQGRVGRFLVSGRRACIHPLWTSGTGETLKQELGQGGRKSHCLRCREAIGMAPLYGALTRDRLLLGT